MFKDSLMVRQMYWEGLPKTRFTAAEWAAYPKTDFPMLIRRWCAKHNFIDYVELGRPVPAKLPYTPVKKSTDLEVATDFLTMADKYRTLHAKK